jgi:hypothetical protein
VSLPTAGRRAPERGQALVELALVVPVVLLLALGVLGLSRVLHARMAVSGVAREAARAAALAQSPAEALALGAARGGEAAAGYGLTNGSFRLALDPGTLERGGWVRAEARYEAVLADLPLFGLERVRLSASHEERVERWRSRWPAGGSP